MPNSIGIEKVKNPKTKLFLVFFLKSTKSISSPAKNIMYNNPAVPESIIPSSRRIKFTPFGPINAPAIIKPNRAGILILFNKIGVNNIITRINKNFNTGFVKGKVVSKILISNTLIYNNLGQLFLS